MFYLFVCFFVCFVSSLFSYVDIDFFMLLFL